MRTLAAIALMGAVGALARHGCGVWIRSRLDLAFPLGTLLVNGLGSFLLGLLTGLAFRGLVSEDLRAPLAIGLLGSFTTYSTFSLETWSLVEQGRPGGALLNVLAQLCLGILAAGLGLWLGRGPGS